MLANATLYDLAIKFMSDSHTYITGTKLIRLSFLHRKTRRASDMLSGEPNVHRRTGKLRERI